MRVLARCAPVNPILGRPSLSKYCAQSAQISILWAYTCTIFMGTRGVYIQIYKRGLGLSKERTKKGCRIE